MFGSSRRVSIVCSNIMNIDADPSQWGDGTLCASKLLFQSMKLVRLVCNHLGCLERTDGGLHTVECQRIRQSVIHSPESISKMHLNLAPHVKPRGRSFISRLDLASSISNLCNQNSLDEGRCSDFKFWLLLMHQWNGISLFCYDTFCSTASRFPKTLLHASVCGVFKGSGLPVTDQLCFRTFLACVKCFPLQLPEVTFGDIFGNRQEQAIYITTKNSFDIIN